MCCLDDAWRDGDRISLPRHLVRWIELRAQRRAGHGGSPATWQNFPGVSHRFLTGAKRRIDSHLHFLVHAALACIGVYDYQDCVYTSHFVLGFVTFQLEISSHLPDRIATLGTVKAAFHTATYHQHSRLRHSARLA
jgi:hypothetical protein